ncbi:MAG: hypothetical protein ACO2ZM_09975 [Francisellaceae bacterium]
MLTIIRFSILVLSLITVAYSQNNTVKSTTENLDKIFAQQQDELEAINQQIKTLEHSITEISLPKKDRSQTLTQIISSPLDTQASYSPIFIAGGAPAPITDKNPARTSSEMNNNASSQSNNDNPYQDAKSDNGNSESQSDDSTDSSDNMGSANNLNNLYPITSSSSSSSSLSLTITPSDDYSYSVAGSSSDFISPFDNISDSVTLKLTFNAYDSNANQIAFCNSTFDSCSDAQALSSSSFTITDDNKDSTINTANLSYISTAVDGISYKVASVYVEFLDSDSNIEEKAQFSFPNANCSTSGDNLSCSLDGTTSATISSL